MTTMKKALSTIALTAGVMGFALPVMAADYLIDTKGAHAAINFKVSHLGYSFVTGRFDDFGGSFSYDAAKPEATKVDVTIKTSSVNSNHAQRDKHLRSGDFLSTGQFPEARFVSTRLEALGDNTAKLYGTLTMKGISKDVVIDVNKHGEGKDPWGGYRAGFSGTTSIALADFKMMNLGPASANVELTLEVEGIKQ